MTQTMYLLEGALMVLDKYHSQPLPYGQKDDMWGPFEC